LDDGSASEVYRITGKRTGNAYFNLWADEPRWTGLTIETLPSEDELSRCSFSEDDPISRLYGVVIYGLGPKR